MKTLTTAADIDKLDRVIDFLEECLEDTGCMARTKMQLELSAEEIFSNIVNYAYPGGTGMVQITVEMLSDPDRICIVFSDSGIPFDPLQKPDPDTTDLLNSRRIGGLGIFMVKKQMDSVSYTYRNGHNILTIEKML